MGERSFSIICLYICDGGIKGLSPKYNGLEWFILPISANSASFAGIRVAGSSLGSQRTQGRVQLVGLVLERSKGPLKG